MAGFADVLGHEQTIAHMKKAIELGKVSHAYIINGEKGSGKGNGAMYALSVMPSGAVHESAGYYQGDP